MPQPPRPLDPGASPLAAFGADLRRRRVGARLSQRDLGGLVHVSGALVGKLEKAQRRPDAELVHRLDRELSADGCLWDAYARLLGPAPAGAGRHLSPAGAGRRRRSVLGYSDVAGLCSAPDPVPVEELRQAVTSAWSAYQASAFHRVCARAPSLLTGARAAVSAPEPLDSGEARRLLAASHHVVAASLAKLGDLTLAAVSADLGLRAATESGEVRMIAALRRCVAHTVMAGSDDAAAVELVEQAVTDLRAASGPEPDDPRVLSLLGSLWLVAAMAAARAGCRGEASAFLTLADGAAERQGRDANHCWTWFGPTNTAMHQVSVAVELGRLDEAARLAAVVPMTGLPRERKVRHTLERARLADLLERPDEAVDHLLDAERQAPVHVRRHFITRDLIRRWAHQPQVTRRADVRGLLTRMTRDGTTPAT